MSPIYLSERSPFIVKAYYEYDEDMDTELEMHFWYVVKEACLMKKALKTKGFLYI